MAQINVVSIGTTGYQWYISTLGSQWNTTNYMLAAIGADGSQADGLSTTPASLWDSFPPPDAVGTSFTTEWDTSPSIFVAGTTYTGYGWVQAANGLWYKCGSQTFVMLPPQVTGLVATLTGDGFVRLTWDAANGATGYKIYYGRTGLDTFATVGNVLTTDITGLQNGTQHYFNVAATNASGEGATSATVYATPNPPPPSGTPSITVSAAAGKTINMSWSGVTGATGYRIYANDNAGSGDVLKADTTASSTSFVVNNQYYTYTVKVVPYNTAGNGTNNTANVTTLDESIPLITSFTVGAITATTIQVSASGSDSGEVSPSLNSGMNKFYFYKNGLYDGVAYGSSVSYTYTGLSAGTSYNLTCYAIDNAINFSSISATLAITTLTRPSNFVWSPALSTGMNPPTAVQVNALNTRINDFRTYKSLAVYSFTTLTAGTYFYWHMNQTRSALVDLNAYMTGSYASGALLPSIKASGDTLYASDLNNFMNSLNSIS